jgi:hypothetical protein
LRGSFVGAFGLSSAQRLDAGLEGLGYEAAITKGGFLSLEAGLSGIEVGLNGFYGGGRGGYEVVVVAEG